MQPEFREVAPELLTDNVIHLIAEEWMLVTAGPPDAFNTMTASWGGLGNLWGLPVSFVFVRPSRYTFEFMNRAAQFTLSFFPEAYHDALMYCGTHSGRDVDKMAETGLTPVVGAHDTVHFAEARLVLECRKLYAQDFERDGFVDHAVRQKVYGSATDFHRFYVGHITRCLTR